MKIRTTLGSGIAVAAVASTILGVATPALATPTTTWNTQVGGFNTGATGMAVSGDGATAFVIVGGATGNAVVPVDLATGAAGTAVSFSASQTTGSPAANGDTVAVAGYDDAFSPGVWSIANGTASTVTLDGVDNSTLVQGVTATDNGFLAVGTVGGCLVSWTWAVGDTTATEGAPACSNTAVLVPFVVATQPGGAVYAAVAAESGSSDTEQLWNLSDPLVAPVDLPASLGSPSGMTFAADGTVYVAGTGADSTNTQLAAVHPGNPDADTVRGTGAYPSGPAQLGMVDGRLWLGSWSGITVLDPADTTSYTPDAPGPTLTTSSGGPQNFIATPSADYLLLPSDAAFTDVDSSTAPGLLEVVAPSAAAPTATLSGTTATVAWNAAGNGGTTITTATVTATDTTSGTTNPPVTTHFFADAGYLDGDAATVDVSGLTRGHSYTFSVTQGNGFFTSTPAATAPLAVPLLATAKPSRVAVTGSPQVGRRLTITTTGSWQSGAVLSYAWYAGTTKVGSSASYLLRAADAGKKIKVAVTGTAPNRAPSTVTSAYVGPVTKPVYKVPNKPTITGTARVGSILTAHITGLPAGAVVKYQWAFNGGQYGGAIGSRTTSTTLKVPASVRGTRIEVIAFVTVPGYATGSAMSALTAVVR